MKYVGLKGFSKYGDEKAFTVEEINRMAEGEEVFVALNRVREADEIAKVAEKLEVSGFIVNELAAVKRLRGKVIVSVGLNALNKLDVEFFRDLGAYAVVVPPEVNDEIDEMKVEGVKIEAFKSAYVEMFYKGKCLLSAYFSGRSAKLDGVCGKECCRKWKVEFDGGKLEITFPPRRVDFDVNADILKFEGRQFGGVEVMVCGIDDERSES